jgi:site-specific recombinase XerD
VKGCRPLTDAELPAVKAALERSSAPARDRALFTLGCRSGFRISELLTIRLADVCRDGKVLAEVEVARSHMKGKRESRRVPLHAEAREAIAVLARELEAQGKTAPDTYLFQSRKGKNRPLNRRSAWEMLKRAYAACGLEGKLATHTMRKTFARKMRAKVGGDLHKLKNLLGHTDIRATEKYLGKNDEELAAAVLNDD